MKSTRVEFDLNEDEQLMPGLISQKSDLIFRLDQLLHHLASVTEEKIIRNSINTNYTLK
jgi:hypothetical protein